MKTAIILFAHGSRSAEWSAPLARIRERVAGQRPDAEVMLAYLELMSPDLHGAVDAAVARGAERITVTPLFLAPGAHVQRDLPRLVEEAIARHPHVRIRVLPAIGECEPLLDAMARWIADAAFED